MSAPASVIAAAKEAGRAAGNQYRTSKTPPADPPSILTGSLLARQAATAWHDGFAATSPFAGSEHAGDAPALDFSAQTAALEVTPAPYGKPGGPGLYGVKGQSHSPYFEQIVRAMIAKGKTKGEASAMAWGILRRWADGGGKVHPEVRAAAAAALAQEAAKRGHLHANDGPALDLAGMFTESLHPRTGGKFAAKGGQPVAAARARNTPKSAAIPSAPGPAGPMTRAQQLRYQASQDRHLAGQLMVRVAGLVRERDAAQAGISAPGAAAAKAAAATKTASTVKKASAKSKQATAAAKIAAAAKTGKPQQSKVARLNGQIKLLTHDTRLLAKAANKLDAQAAAQ